VRACIIQNGHISLPDPRLFFFSFSGISDSTRTAALYVRRTSKPLEANLKFHPSPIFYYFCLFCFHDISVVQFFFSSMFYFIPFFPPIYFKIFVWRKKKRTRTNGYSSSFVLCPKCTYGRMGCLRRFQTVHTTADTHKRTQAMIV
jgi:hypothetical protein